MTQLNSDLLDTRNRLISNKALKPGKSVLYIMSRDRRIKYNYSLATAQQSAIQQKLPLAVVYCLYKVENRAREHLKFILTGLKELESDLKQYNIPLMLLFGEPERVLPGLIHHTQPCQVFVDFNPLNHAKKWQKELSKIVPLVCVDSHNTVPAWVASDKQEYSARTIRPKIHHHLNDFLVPPPDIINHPYIWPGKVMNLEQLKDLTNKLLSKYQPNNTNLGFKSGPRAARKRLESFISSKLANYATNRNNPAINDLSGLSPYLHFGQISSTEVLIRVKSALNNDSRLQTGHDILLEEMIIRKELSDNYCLYNTNYRSLKGAPDWAIQTLNKHRNDPKEFLYNYGDFEQARTHDPAWNAAQRELLKTGKMHGYMRMYWAKKVLEWSNLPEEAINILIRLNDFYSLDGGDPNGYVGILWSIAGLHDRPWGERPVYGTVRSMVYGGLKRKFPIQDYIIKNS